MMLEICETAKRVLLAACCHATQQALLQVFVRQACSEDSLISPQLKMYRPLSWQSLTTCSCAFQTETVC